MKLSSLMRDYLEDDSKNLIRESLINEKLSTRYNQPIVPKKNTWEHLKNPEAIKKTFIFENSGQKLIFLEDVMQIEDELQHNPDIYINDKSITVILMTKVIECVTEIDIEMAAEIDKIYDDCKS